VGEGHVPVIPFPILTAFPNILFGSEPAKTLNLGHLRTLKFYLLLWNYIYIYIILFLTGTILSLILEKTSPYIVHYI
jgi:hypothetical protein